MFFEQKYYGKKRRMVMGKRSCAHASLCVFCLMVFLLALAGPAKAVTVTPEVAAKVNEVVASVVTADMSQRDKASALHDWLTDNAYYDTTFTYFGPEGVLLHQTGVCQSYTEAYQLLLEKAGIESRVMTGMARNSEGGLESHAWNLVKIDGTWRHVDVTWDDPVNADNPKEKLPKSGLEMHYFFLVSSRFILEDHIPDEESAAFIREYANTSDEVGENLLPSPVKTDKNVEMPEFSMKTTDGTLLTKSGFGKGKRMLIVYGRTICSNTELFMRVISPYINILKNSQVTVLLALFDDPSVKEMQEMEELYPGVVCAKLTDGDSSMWEGIWALGYQDNSLVFPVVFLKNEKDAITYYSVGYVEEPLKIVSGALQMTSQASANTSASEESSSQVNTSSGGTSGSQQSTSTEKAGASQKTTSEKKKTSTSKTIKNVKIGSNVYTLDLKKKTAVFTGAKSKKAKKLNIPATVKYKKVTYKVTDIGKNACKGMKNLAELTIGKNVKTIGANAFKSCKALKKITLKTEKLKTSSVGNSAFKGIHAKAKVKVPRSKVKSYKTLLKKKGIGKNVTVSA